MMKQVLSFLAATAALFSAGDAFSRDIPAGPLAGIHDRLAALERDVNELKSADGESLVLIDSQGLEVGSVISASPDLALTEIEFRGSTWRVVFDMSGPFAGPKYVVRIFPTENCEGQPHYYAFRFFGEQNWSVWGDGYLPFDGIDNVFKLPREGAVAKEIEAFSLFSSITGQCISTSDGVPFWTGLVYGEDDLEVVDLMEGFIATYRIAAKDR
jgi:hypothetical protein